MNGRWKVPAPSGKTETTSPVITLATDFGLEDPFVAEMKGVILGLNPAAAIVDITHAIRPQQVEQGAFIVASAAPHFPQGTIHVAVVDPGVGSERLPAVLETPDALFVGPDNGILSAGLPEQARAAAGHRPRPVPLPAGFTAYVLADERFRRHPVSNTFHGRDIFAPAAAYLSLGVPPTEFGPSLEELVVFPPFRAQAQADGSLLGRVLHVDHFGNLVTTVLREQIAGRRPVVEIERKRMEGLVRTYAEGEGLMALIGSRDRLEIAMRNGSAAAETGADIGTTLRVSFA